MKIRKSVKENKDKDSTNLIEDGMKLILKRILSEAYIVMVLNKVGAVSKS